MLFNSVSYFVFLAAFVSIIWLAPRPARRWAVLTASLIFYGSWRIEFLLLIMFSAYVDYFFARKIYASDSRRGRRLFLIASVSINVGLLLYFKYAYFIADNLNLLFSVADENWRISPGKIILPLGISFYTFLSISYTIDVYRGLFVPVNSFLLYLTYVVFWPHMIAGPILRACELLPQISNNHFRPTWAHAVKGLQKILFGLFLKVVLADQLAPLVDSAFSMAPSTLSPLDVWTMAFAFGFQIYFDFAGYSMIAIGSAQLINVKFPENFNWPYLSTSPREFWKRWHITLSSWIRDYLYLPLSGAHFQDRSAGGIDIERAKVFAVRTTVALFLTWFVMGLWHGAQWSFAIWGIWHAACIYAYRLVSRVRIYDGSQRIRQVLGFCTTLPIMMLGWIPFRAKSVDATAALMGRVLDFSDYGRLSFRENFYLFVFLLLIGMLGLRAALELRNRFSRNLMFSAVVTGGAYGAVMFLVFIFFGTSNQFIYFQF